MTGRLTSELVQLRSLAPLFMAGRLRPMRIAHTSKRHNDFSTKTTEFLRISIAHIDSPWRETNTARLAGSYRTPHLYLRHSGKMASVFSQNCKDASALLL